MSPAAAHGSARRLLPAGQPRAGSNLRVVPPRAAHGAGSPRAPFVVLVLLLLGSGLVGLLLLNTSLQQGAFELTDLEGATAVLRDRQAELADEVAGRSAPDALARSARSLGMVQSEEPVFLHLGAGGAG